MAHSATIARDEGVVLTFCEKVINWPIKARKEPGNDSLVPGTRFHRFPENDFQENDFQENDLQENDSVPGKQLLGSPGNNSLCKSVLTDDSIATSKLRRPCTSKLRHPCILILVSPPLKV